MTNHTRACPACGNTFTSIRSDAVMCSPKCAYRIRKARSLGVAQPEPRTCLGCSTDLSSRHRNARYCGDCYTAREKLHRENRARPATCPHCGAIFTARTGREKYCTRRCSGLAARARQLGMKMHRMCIACGIGFVATDARQVTCSIACRLWSRSHPGEPRVTGSECPVCETSFTVARVGQTYCTANCRSAAEKRRNGRKPHQQASTPKRLKPYTRHDNCAACKRPMPSEKRAGTKYCSRRCADWYYAAPDRFLDRFGRTCERCGTSIPDTARVNKRFCCTSCQVLFNQDIRRARKRGLPSEKISRPEIFTRDGMTCHLCSRLIDEKPSLDHIIPLSHPDSPGHVWENVAAAHLACNISKRDRVRLEDWALYRELLARKAGGSWQQKRAA